MNTLKRIGLAVGASSVLVATAIGSALALNHTGTVIAAVDVAALAGMGTALVLAVLASANLAGHHTLRQSDQSGVLRLGEFLGQARIHASAQRGWISWSPLG